MRAAEGQGIDPMSDQATDDPVDAAPRFAVEHPNVMGMRRELALDQNRWRYILVVLTDLSLDPGDPAHSAKDLDQMVRAVNAAATKAGVGYDVLSIRNP
ncbi:MAG: hypothetical protein RIB45_12415 [Marivibrio sp.]|uniref:hypothetical protein n=1 Tax=Marivibrio sp. TaxID=2039719 RepID=UPI0032EAB5E1